MFLFSTILYFAEEPAGYDVYKEDNGFSFRRAIDTFDENIPAVINAVKKGTGWEFYEQESEDIQNQIIRIIHMNDNIELPGQLTAAS